MELLNIEGEMLTADGGVVRRLKVKGDGYSNPNEGATVDGSNIIFPQIIVEIAPVDK